MKIIKKENGNIEILDNDGNPLHVITGGCCVTMTPKCQDDILQLFVSGQYINIPVADVTATQLEPDAEVPFAGDIFALIALLSADFFFELAGGGFDIQYNKVNWQNFLATTPSVTSYANAIAPNLLLAFPIYIGEDTTIEQLKIKITVGAAGNSVWGLYLAENGLPTDLIFQTTAFNNAVVAPAIYTLPTPQAVTKGFYYIGYNSSSAPGLALSCANSTSLHSIMGGDTSDVPAALLGRALVYSGTLPATFGVPTTYYSTISVVSIPLVQFIIS